MEIRIKIKSKEQGPRSKKMKKKKENARCKMQDAEDGHSLLVQLELFQELDCSCVCLAAPSLRSKRFVSVHHMCCTRRRAGLAARQCRVVRTANGSTQRKQLYSRIRSLYAISVQSKPQVLRPRTVAVRSGAGRHKVLHIRFVSSCPALLCFMPYGVKVAEEEVRSIEKG